MSYLHVINSELKIRRASDTKMQAILLLQPLTLTDFVAATISGRLQSMCNKLYNILLQYIIYDTCIGLYGP